MLNKKLIYKVHLKSSPQNNNDHATQLLQKYQSKYIETRIKVKSGLSSCSW